MFVTSCRSLDPRLRPTGSVAVIARRARERLLWPRFSSSQVIVVLRQSFQAAAGIASASLGFGAASDFLAQPLERVVAPEQAQALLGEVGEGEDLGARFVEQRGRLGEAAFQLGDDPGVLLAHRVGRRAGRRSNAPSSP